MSPKASRAFSFHIYPFLYTYSYQNACGIRGLLLPYKPHSARDIFDIVRFVLCACFVLCPKRILLKRSRLWFFFFLGSLGKKKKGVKFMRAE